MSRQKATGRRNLEAANDSFAGQVNAEDALGESSGNLPVTDVGFRPTEQRVYEVELDRIMPDPDQPRHLLPYDLRTAVHEKSLSPAEAMSELLARARQEDMVALLILGGRDEGKEAGSDEAVEDKGLLALAHSIRTVGLRQPLNVYRLKATDRTGQIRYRLGEGERRFWAHHLLVQQGYQEFKRVKCIIEELPDDEEIIHQRQEAENAARIDLPATARARSIQRLKDRLNMEMAVRIPGKKTIQLPSQRELQTAIGQRVKSLTGRAISDRMVRNYLAILKLPPEAQDLAEAAQLTEKQLRPVLRLKTDEEQLELIQQIVEKNWSARRVQQEVSSASPPLPAAPPPVEQQLEQRVLEAARLVYSLLSLPEEDYEQALAILAAKARNKRIRQALQVLQQALEEILTKADNP